MESDGKDGVSVGRQPEVQSAYPSCGYAEIVQGTGGHRPFRDRAPATISEMTAKSVSGLVESAKKLQESSRSKTVIFVIACANSSARQVRKCMMTRCCRW